MHCNLKVFFNQIKIKNKHCQFYLNNKCIEHNQIQK